MQMRLRFIIGTFICALMLMGCGAQKTQPEEYEVKESDEKYNIAFSWWGNDPRHLYTMEGVDIFMQENPDISVEYRYGIWNGFETRNKIYMNSNTAPDVMQINFSWLSQYSPDGKGYYDLYELTDYIDLSGFDEADLSFGLVNGKLNALPIAYNSTAIIYNSDIYSRYGLELPKTWDDLFESAAVMSKDGIYPLGGVKKHVFLILVAYYEQTTGKNMFDSNGKCLLEEEDMVYILEFYKKLIDEKVLIPIDKFDRNLLTSGELAGVVFWISDINNYSSSMEANGKPAIGTYLMDDINKPLVGWYKKPATMYAISNSTSSPEASARLLDFLINNPQMAILQGTEKGVPVSRKALQAIEDAGLLDGYCTDANNQMIEAGAALKTMIPIMEDEELIDNIKSNADAYIYGKVDVHEAAKDIINNMK